MEKVTYLFTLLSIFILFLILFVIFKNFYKNIDVTDDIDTTIIYYMQKTLYLLTTFSLVNVFLISYLIYKNYSNNRIIQQEFDFVIVGAGVTGSYLSNRLSQQFPDKKILVLEKNNNIGGRLISVNHKKNLQENPLEIADEHGGMRFFPNIHPCVNKLVKLFDLKTVIVPYISDTDLFYGRGQSFKNNALFPETDSIYRLKNNEVNHDVLLTVKKNIFNVFKRSGVDPADIFKYKKELYDDVKLTSLDFKHEVVNGLIPISNDNWKRYLDISGYGDTFDSGLQFLSSAIEDLSLDNKSTHKNEAQHFVKHGFNQIPIKLLNGFDKITLNDLFGNIKSNNLFMNNVNFYKFKEISDNKVLINASDNNNNHFSIITKNLYICTPKDSVDKIKGFDKKFIYSMEKNVKEIPLFKIFLKYNNNWWNKLGFYGGRCTTDLEFGQLWFYNNNTLMSYAASNKATFWSKLIPKHHQLDFIPINNETSEIANTLVDMYKDFFKDYNVDIPMPDGIAWSYHPNGMSFWKSGNKNEPTNSIIKNLINVNKNENIHYLNNDICLNQSWIEGCFELVDEFIKDKYDMPGLLEHGVTIKK